MLVTEDNIGTLNRGDLVYFMGIGGTGMAPVAGLAQEAGFRVVGSDMNLYPPMSTMLEDLKIPVLTPYSPENIRETKPRLVVVANALSRKHPELEALIEADLPFTSFPSFLGAYFLNQRNTLVVSGTHGKTTTSSLAAHGLKRLGFDPGYLIGGVPRDLPRSFALGKDPMFVIEGDEYDTAYFDKHSKFLHYCPKHLIINNIEYDHADIFPNVEAIEAEFIKLIRLVPDPRNIVANVDDQRVTRLLQDLSLYDIVTRVATTGLSRDAHVTLKSLDAPGKALHGSSCWSLSLTLPDGEIFSLETELAGAHNAANICQVVGYLWNLYVRELDTSFPIQAVQRALGSFSGVKRRMDKLASVNGIDVIEDFAHHPTAVRTVLESLKKSAPTRRILLAFEPKNASSRRNVFLTQFADALGLADEVFVAPCPIDSRIPEDLRMNTATLASLIGPKALAFSTYEEVLHAIVQRASPNDLVVFMSSGSFAGIQHQVGELLRHKGG